MYSFESDEREQWNVLGEYDPYAFNRKILAFATINKCGCIFWMSTSYLELISNVKLRNCKCLDEIPMGEGSEHAFRLYFFTAISLNMKYLIAVTAGETRMQFSKMYTMSHDVSEQPKKA